MQQQLFMRDAHDMKSAASISRCGTFRWILSREWNPKKGKVCWIMLNPSTADWIKDDPTLSRCIHFTRLWDYGGLEVVNLFPFRSSKPKECQRWADWEPSHDWWARDVIYYQNMPIVIERAKAADLVVAAWGYKPWAMLLADQIAQEIQEDAEPYPDIYCLGTTSNGQPKHPMARGRHRVPNEQAPILWKKS
jgi:hypothetical protein